MSITRTATYQHTADATPLSNSLPASSCLFFPGRQHIHGIYVENYSHLHDKIQVFFSKLEDMHRNLEKIKHGKGMQYDFEEHQFQATTLAKKNYLKIAVKALDKIEHDYQLYRIYCLANALFRGNSTKASEVKKFLAHKYFNGNKHLIKFLTKIQNETLLDMEAKQKKTHIKTQKKRIKKCKLQIFSVHQKIQGVLPVIGEHLIKQVEIHRPISQQAKIDKITVLKALKALRKLEKGDPYIDYVNVDALKRKFVINTFPDPICDKIRGIRERLEAYNIQGNLNQRKALIHKFKGLKSTVTLLIKKKSQKAHPASDMQKPANAVPKSSPSNVPEPTTPKTSIFSSPRLSELSGTNKRQNSETKTQSIWSTIVNFFSAICQWFVRMWNIFWH